jgi:hypothetical protein
MLLCNARTYLLAGSSSGIVNGNGFTPQPPIGTMKQMPINLEAKGAAASLSPRITLLFKSPPPPLALLLLLLLY